MSVNKKDTHGFIVTNESEISFRKFQGLGFSEAFKASNKKNLYVSSCVFYGGYEDCLDSVRSQINVFDCLFLPNKQTKQSITAKGGSDLMLELCHFENNPKFDIVVGDFTIYDGVKKMPPSKLLLRDCKASDKGGRKRQIRVLVLHGSCSFKNSDVKITKVPKWLVKIYFWVMQKLMTKARRKEAIRNLLEANK